MAEAVAPRKASLDAIKAKLVEALQPLEGADNLFVITDARTGARYCECHVRGSKFIQYATPDAPLDPDDQSEYRANREVVQNAPAFARMKDDARKRRSFSGIVVEYIHKGHDEKPIKIVGGQHRYHAISEALESGIDEWHGLKIYLDLTMAQRLDAQLISNTVIAVSTNLFDRLHETHVGTHLRDWCQAAGLLNEDEDFGDRRALGGPITVQFARTFIMSYFEGMKVFTETFDNEETVPPISISGQHDNDWDKLKQDRPDLWGDAALKRAGSEFARLTGVQRQYFVGRKPKPPIDYPEKANNLALMGAWAYVAGVLRSNQVRLERHYALADRQSRDPLNAAVLRAGRHKSDAPNYRGLGSRSDFKERGRFAELFFLQAEDGSGITASNVDIAIKKHLAKQFQLEVKEAQAKA